MLLVDDPRETLAYDDEWTVVLDDWLDDVAGTPDEALAKLQDGGAHGEQGGEGSSEALGGPGGDVAHPHYLLNGRLPAAPETFRARPGSRLRLRLVNAGGDTAFRVALGGHRMTVTHADGFPVKPSSRRAAAGHGRAVRRPGRTGRRGVPAGGARRG